MYYSAHRSVQQQRGLSFTGVLIILAVATFIGMFAVKVGPHYFDHWTVTSITKDLESKPEILKQSRSKVYRHINDAYDRNNLWDLKAEDTIHLAREADKGYVVTVEYERRANLFSNIDVVTSFRNDAQGDPIEE